MKLLKCVTSFFDVQYDKEHGSISKIAHPEDSFAMNWVFTKDASIQYPPSVEHHKWGLGSCVLETEGEETPFEWYRPVACVEQEHKSEFTYTNRHLHLVVSRQFNDQGEFQERYRFVNTSGAMVRIKKMGIYTPFNDNYPGAALCLTNRCNAHIWAGGSTSYINAMRMGGDAPHLAMVISDGFVAGYSILDKIETNTRGIIVLNFSDMDVPAGGHSDISWTFFWHKGWEDFFEKVAPHKQFVKASTERYIVPVGDSIHVFFDTAKQLEGVQCFVNDAPVAFAQEGTRISVEHVPRKPGDYVFSIRWNGNQATWLRTHAISSFQQLLEKRATFIVEHQQMNDPQDERFGAYMVYDNEARQIYRNDGKRCSPADTDEGAERLGMGIFLAKYCQETRDAVLFHSLERYYAFVRGKLQTTDYWVYSNATRTSRHRHYNYPWVCQFYLEMYKLTADLKYLHDSLNTWLEYYEVWGPCKWFSHIVGAREMVDALAAAGLARERQELLGHFVEHADFFASGDAIPDGDEVSYVGLLPVVKALFLGDVYALTQERKYLDEVFRMLPLIMAITGEQPDFRLNGVQIAHWDGFWFGKSEAWGDSMPQYYTVLSAEAFMRYYELTGDKDFFRKSRTIIESVFSLFFEDGSASCAYIYPDSVNGRAGKFYDAFANDQDWSLYYYLRARTRPAKAAGLHPAPAPLNAVTAAVRPVI